MKKSTMDQKPPRPQTLRIGSPNNKRTQRTSRHRRTPLKRNPLELQLLAEDIKGIIEDISFETAEEEHNEDGLRRSYVGIHRRSTVDRSQRRPPRDVISAFYRERQSKRNEIAISDQPGSFESEKRQPEYNKRVSCPWDLPYFNQSHEGTPLEILAQELKYARDVREKEVRSLLHYNTKLQNDLLENDREMCSLEEKNVILDKKYDEMLKVYERIRENLKRCLTKVKDLECIGRLSSANNSDDESIHRVETFQAVADSLSSGINTWMSDASSISTSVNGYDGDGEASLHTSTYNKNQESENKPNEYQECGPVRDDPNGTMSPTPMADRQLLMRLQADVNSLSLVNSEQSQEIERLRNDLSSCRKHMSSTQFQLEAVEIECSRLLSMEDQLISIVNLLKWAKEKHVHRQILGDHIYAAVDAAKRGDYTSAGLPADLFLRELQDQLSANPILSVDGKLEEQPARPHSRSSDKRKGMHFDHRIMDQIKFADDEDEPFSDTDSFHSLGKHLNDTEEP
ncbi:uncharacterized protein [Mytilus edulis]